MESYESDGQHQHQDEVDFKEEKFIESTSASNSEFYHVTKNNKDFFVKKYKIEMDNFGLLYETALYKLIKKCIIDTNICINFIPFYTAYMFKNRRYILNITRFLKEDDKVSKVMKFSDFINGYRDIMTVQKVMYQIFFALRVMAKMGITHNDLHANNIIIGRYKKPINLSYLEDNGRYVNISTHYVPYIFDWDFGYCKYLGNNYDLYEHCIMYDLCNIFNDYKDVYILLCSSQGLRMDYSYLPKSYIKLLETKGIIIKGNESLQTKANIIKKRDKTDDFVKNSMYKLYDVDVKELKKIGIPVSKKYTDMKYSIPYNKDENISELYPTYDCRPKFKSDRLLNIFKISELFMKSSNLNYSKTSNGNIKCRIPRKSDVEYMLKLIGNRNNNIFMRRESFEYVEKNLDKYVDYVMKL